jgi:hypothetical protein
MEASSPFEGIDENWEEIDFGTRECKLCPEQIAAPEFGRHLSSHSDLEIAHYPGGIRGFYGDLIDSLEQSLAAAEGYPLTSARLERSLKILKRERMRMMLDLN